MIVAMLYYQLFVSIIFIFSHNTISGQYEDSFFYSCDVNRDKYLDKHEFGDCFSRFSLPSIHSSREDNVESYYLLLDKNGDGSVSLEEYSQAVTRLQTKPDQLIDFTSHDGQRMEIHMEELSKLPGFSDHDLKHEDGKLVKQKSGISKLSDLKDVSPQLDQMARVGMWAHTKLMETGYAYGQLSGARSSPGHDVRFEATGKFEIYLILKVYNKTEDRQESFEVAVVRDKERYVKPHLHILEAWLLDSNDQRHRKLELSSRHGERQISPRTLDLAVKILFSVICFIVVYTMIIRKK